MKTLGELMQKWQGHNVVFYLFARGNEKVSKVSVLQKGTDKVLEHTTVDISALMEKSCTTS